MGCTNGFIQLPLSEKRTLIIDVSQLKIKRNMTKVYGTDGFDSFISCFAALNVSNKNDTLNHIYFKKTSNFMLQLDLTTFFSQKNPGWPFLSTDFFSCPIWIYEPFLRHTAIWKEGLRKVLDDKKCWGQRNCPALFFSEQRVKSGILSYPSTEINLPFKNKGSQMELWKKHIRGGRKQGKGQYGK